MTGRSAGGAGGRRPPASERTFWVRRVAVLAVFSLVAYGVFQVVTMFTDDDSGVANEPTTPIPTAPTPTGAANTTAAPAPTGSPTTAADHDAPPSADDPTRIYIVGDSDAGTFGPYLEILIDGDDEFDDRVDVTLDSRASTGLARPDYFNWPEYLGDKLDEVDPDIVVATFGGNDSQGLTEPCASGNRSCNPNFVVGDPVTNEEEWTTEYRQRVRTVLDMMLEGGRQVIWVGIPNAADAKQTERLRIQDRAVRAELAESPEVVFIDTWDRFDGGRGGYAQVVVDPRDGRAKPIRADDGFHLNTTGAEILALEIFDEVIAHLRDLE